MPRENPSPGEPFPLLDEGDRFEGLVAFSGDSRVDGTLVGEVVATGRLVVGAAAAVEARIEVDELVVDGRLEGDVVARSRIELRSTARVMGRLCAPRVAFAEGCSFDGRCETGSDPPATA